MNEFWLDSTWTSRVERSWKVNSAIQLKSRSIRIEQILNDSMNQSRNQPKRTFFFSPPAGREKKNKETKIIETFEEGEIEKNRDKWPAIFIHLTHFWPIVSDAIKQSSAKSTNSIHCNGSNFSIFLSNKFSVWLIELRFDCIWLQLLKIPKKPKSLNM